jgi:magnesium-protoporphyrin O-methyltransferase
VAGCCGEGIPSCEHVFDRRTAEADRRRLNRAGPPWATRKLIDELGAGIEVAGTTVLDVGAGVGGVHLALLDRGAAAAVDVDGSSAYVDVARDEARRRGHEERVRHVVGDLTAVAPGLAAADLVALDRVVCCYGDVAGLLGAAAALTRRRLGLVYPRDTWWLRLAATVANASLFRRSAGYRMWIHAAGAIEVPLRAAGLARRTRRDGIVWRVETWERVGRPAPGGAASGRPEVRG